MDLILLYINETFSVQIVDQFKTLFEKFAKGDYTEHEHELNELLMSSSLMTPEELQDNVYQTMADHARSLIQTCSVIFVEDEVPMGILIDFIYTLQQIEETDEIAGLVDILIDQSMNPIERFATIVEFITGRQVEESAQYIEDVSETLFTAMMELLQRLERLNDVDEAAPVPDDIKALSAKLIAINTPSPTHFNVMNLVEDGLLVGMEYSFYDTYLTPFEHIDSEDEEGLAQALTSLAVISSDSRTNVVGFLEDVLLHTAFDDIKRGRILTRIRELFIRANAANAAVANLHTGNTLNEQG